MPKLNIRANIMFILFIDSTPVSSPRTTRDTSDYVRLARKGGGHPG